MPFGYISVPRQFTDSISPLGRCIFEETTIPCFVSVYSDFQIMIRIPYSLPGMAVLYSTKISDYLEENFNISRLDLINDYYETIKHDYENRDELFKVIVYRVSEECFCEVQTLLKLKGYC